MNNQNLFQYSIQIQGNVQGVFFRKYSQEKANELGVTGWVKNEPSGDVIMNIQGSESQCLNMIKWCHKGSPFSHVSKVIPKKEKINSIYEAYIIEQ